MKTISGRYTSAMIFTDMVEDYALAQIQMLCDNPVFEGCQVRVMPDVHPGHVVTVGFTTTVGDKIMPNIVGADIGCGMMMVKLKQKKLEFQKLDTVIRDNIPSGSKIRKKSHRLGVEFPYENLLCADHINLDKAPRSIGSLGGGNHFLEVDQDSEGNLYVVIHTGSRHLGKEVTDYYLKEGQKTLKAKGIDLPYELTYLEGELKDAYMHDVEVVQNYADCNREAIMDELMKGMKLKATDCYSCIHNYIGSTREQPIIRKGAISALVGEVVIIPINMRDGIILGTGKGNPDWNYSAPHGAGRIMNRTRVKEQFTVSDFKKSMKGIYSSSIGKDTLDEAPFAYRNLDQIVDSIKDTVEIQEIIRPVYNFKAGGDD